MAQASGTGGRGRGPAPGLSTGGLVDRARTGDRRAVEEFAQRIHGLLVLWGHGKLPLWARQGVSTADVAQDVTVEVLARLLDPKAEPPGAIRGFVRRALRNEIVDRIRSAQRRPAEQLEDADARPGPGPGAEDEYLERLAFEVAFKRVREAMSRLSRREQRLIELRLEEKPFPAIAGELGFPTADAARVAHNRAMDRLKQLVLAGARDERRAAGRADPSAQG